MNLLVKPASLHGEAGSTQAHVELKGVTKKYAGVVAVSDLNLAVQRGEFCALLGPSGCGKSTLLRMVAGLEDVTSGRVFINGGDVTDMPPAKRRIAMVFQSYALYPHLSVRDNISFSLSVARAPKGVIEQRCKDVAQMLQLEGLLDRLPAQLSGGQRQRVAIGRALVREPEVFLFDEPLSNLDAMLRVQMRLELRKLHRELGATMIYVTHDQVEAMTLADKIVVLDRGVIAQIGSPLDLYNRPENKFVATFIGSPTMNFLPVVQQSIDGSLASVVLGQTARITLARRHASLSADGKIATEIGVRPEHVRHVSSTNADAHLFGEVLFVEHLGNSTILHVDTDAGRVVVEAEGGDESEAGQKVGLVLNLGRSHLFGGDGLVI
jgi:ABC-type sugar transport system ATPase subunit